MHTISGCLLLVFESSILVVMKIASKVVKKVGRMHIESRRVWIVWRLNEMTIVSIVTFDVHPLHFGCTLRHFFRQVIA